jgi:hypothetical protein
MSPEKKTDYEKGGAAAANPLTSAVQTVFGSGPGPVFGANEVVQLLTQILTQFKDHAARSVFTPPALGPEAAAAVQSYRLIRAALEYPARDRAQIPSSLSTAGGASQTGAVAQAG